MKRTFVIAASACLCLTAAGMQAGIAPYTATVYTLPGGDISVAVPPTSVSGYTNDGTFTNATGAINYYTATGTLANFISYGSGVASTALTLAHPTLVTTYGCTTAYNCVMSNATGNPDTRFSTEIEISTTATFNPGDKITIVNDDGVVLTLGGLGAVINDPSPQSAGAGESYTFTSAFNGSFLLDYVATNGNPEQLTVTTALATVPEPTSIILLGTTFLGLSTLVRRKFRKA